MSKVKKRIAVIGGGASGMVAAIEASKKGYDVTVYERNKKLGRKILATGNGRCNITNASIDISHFHGSDPTFAAYAIKQFGFEECRRYFAKLGLEIVQGNNTRYYPMALQASSVVDVLSYTLKSVGVNVRLESEVTALTKENELFFLHDNRGEHRYHAVIIATGSAAMPTLGSSDSGYGLAKTFGHKVITPYASLVQLVCSETNIHQANGVKIDADIEVLANGVSLFQTRGDLLFTNYGLSGSAILDVSRSVSKALTHGQNVILRIDLMPDMSKDALKSLLTKRLKVVPDLPLDLWLNGVIHKKLIPLVLERAKIAETQTLNPKLVQRIVYVLKSLDVVVSDTKGTKSCEVMAGGIATDQIDSKKMQSTLVEGLYFCGEVLDVDGDCGGYNLHFAWASALLAANAI